MTLQRKSGELHNIETVVAKIQGSKKEQRSYEDQIRVVHESFKPVREHLDNIRDELDQLMGSYLAQEH